MFRKGLQRDLNSFTNEYLRYVTPLIVDGRKGHATKKRVKMVKWELGFVRSRCDSRTGHEFRVRLRHPTQQNKYADTRSLKRGRDRRAKQRKQAERNHAKSHVTSGVTRYDNVPVAIWMVPYLAWAREHGWRGRLVSGWRDPAYSESLCRRICGRNSCAGLCAGRSSNHSGSVKPKGALDVSDYWNFRSLMGRCPYSPRLTNHLPRDPVHVSASGY